MKKAGKSVLIKRLNDDGTSIYRYTPSFSAVVPEKLKSHFSFSERAKMRFRLIRGYWLYYVADENDIYAYDFIKKNYLNTYTFMQKGDVISNPNFTFPEHRGRGYAGLLHMAAINDGEIPWKRLWGVIKIENIPPKKAARRAGFEQIGYSKRKGSKHYLTDEKTGLEIYCCERKKA